MTLSDPAVLDVRARTQNETTRRSARATSTNAPGRPSLRVVDGRTQTPAEPTRPTNDHAASTHWEAATGAVAAHETVSALPPTLAEAAGNLWLDRADTPHGLIGQLGAATAGLAQMLGLALCWGLAHALFSSKTRAAIFALLLLGSLTTCSVATHG